MKTGSGDEIAWLEKVIFDQKLKMNIIDLRRLIHVFLSEIDDSSFEGLFEKYNEKPLKNSPLLMEQTLKLGEKILKEIVYLFSRKDSLLFNNLLELTKSVKDLPEFDAVYQIVSACKDSGWLVEDILANPNPDSDGLDLIKVNGKSLVKPVFDQSSHEIDTEENEKEKIEKITAISSRNFFNSDFIKENLPGYKKREPQVKYSIEVVKALNKPVHYYAEAPTGIGKSLGYLVPSALFIEKNPDKKIIIATATKNLQKQIIDKDWPLIQKRFPGLKIASLKGKSNYVCLSALQRQFKHYFSPESK